MSTTILAQPPGCVNPSQHLHPRFRELYRALCNLCKRAGYCWISNEALAREYAVSLATIERWISRLRDFGLIRSEFDHQSHRRHIYCLVPLAALRPGKKGVPLISEGECPSFSQDASHAGDDSSNLPENTPQHATPALCAPPEATVPPCASVVVSSASVSPTAVRDAAPPVPPEILQAQQELIQAGVHVQAAQLLARQNAQECLKQLRAFRDYPRARSLPALLRAAITNKYSHAAPAAPPAASARRSAPPPPPPDPAAPDAALAMVANLRDRLGPRRRA